MIDHSARRLPQSVLEVRNLAQWREDKKKVCPWEPAVISSSKVYSMEQLARDVLVVNDNAKVAYGKPSSLGSDQ